MTEPISSPNTSPLDTTDSSSSPSSSLPPASKKSVSPILVLLAGMILGGGVLGVTLFAFPELVGMLTQRESVSQTVSGEDTRESQSTVDSELSQPSKPTQTFTSPHLDLSFSYDPEEWAVSEKNIEGGGYVVSLKEKNSSGELVLGYVAPYGVGGGLDVLKSENQLTTVSTAGDYSIVRYKVVEVSDNTYKYGMQHNSQSEVAKSPVVIFSTSPTDKQNIVKLFCSGGDGMNPLTEEDCQQIQSGEIVGYINQPIFDWSMEFKTKVDLVQAGFTWADDEYFKSSGIDFSKLSVTFDYEGKNPEKADEIVKQLKPILML